MKIVWWRRLANEYFHRAQQSATWRIVVPSTDVIIQHVAGVVTTTRYGNAVGAKEAPVVLKVPVDTKAPFVYQCVVL